MNTCWLIWNNTNKCFHNNACRMLTGLVFSASKMQNEFHEASLNTGLQVNVENHVWTPLEKDTLKLNVDAAFSLNSKNEKFGMMVHDSSSVSMWGFKCRKC